MRPYCFIFILTEACLCKLELAYCAGKISKNRLVCKNALLWELQAPSNGLLPGVIVKQIQSVVIAGLEHGTTGLRVLSTDHSAKLLLAPCSKRIVCELRKGRLLIYRKHREL